MLEFFFEDQTRLMQMRLGPLGGHVDGLAGDLRRRGYARSSARSILTLAAGFSQYARAEGIHDARMFDEELGNRFIKNELGSLGIFRNASNAVHHVLTYLRRVGTIPEVETPRTQSPNACLLENYEGHLRDVRGLKTATRNGYQRGAKRLLSWLDAKFAHRPLGKLSGPDILAYITETLDRNSGAAWRNHVLGETRAFLRWLHWEGILSADLCPAIPRGRRYRLASIPRHLDWSQVRALVDGIDLTFPEGMRDKAILLLIATLGLRSGEVRSLALKDVAWHRGELRLSQTKSRRQRVLPLPKDVGAALADYILHGRPTSESPHIFLRHKGPCGPLRTTGAIGAIVHKHLLRAGSPSPCRSAHLLRRSLATRMVNVGVPIKEIADILGHVSIDTTAIYTKVDVPHLLAVALPFPKGGTA